MDIDNNLDIELKELLPKNLWNMLVSLFHENRLLNYRIFGSDFTYISMKLESITKDTEPVMQNTSTNLTFKPKSPSTLKRDYRRLAAWRTGTPIVNHIEGQVSNSQVGSVLDNDLMQNNTISMDSHGPVILVLSLMLY